MKTGACLLVIVLLAASQGAAFYEITGQDDSGITVSFDFSGLSDVYSEGGEWAGCRVQGFAASLVESSGMDIPAEVLLFAVPPTGDVRLSVVSSSLMGERALRMNPSPELIEELAGVSDIPAEITSSGFMRGQRIAAVRVSPVVFDETDGTFRVYERLEIRLAFSGGRRQAGVAGLR